MARPCESYRDFPPLDGAPILPSSPPPPGPSLRLLTMNMCCQLPGARNRYNVSLIKNTCLSLLALCLPAAYAIWRRHPNVSPLFTFPVLLVVALVATQPLAMAVSGVVYMFLQHGFSEFKTERILEFSKHMDRYDVIACQEVYGSWWFGSRYYQTLMKREAKRRGLPYSCTSGLPIPPAIMFDQGLAIYSRLPIHRSRRLVYKAQSPWDVLFVRRAALYVELVVPAAFGETARHVHVFTTHATPAIGDMKKRSGIAALLRDGDVPTVARQGVELSKFVRDMTGSARSDDLIVVMGDFNVEGGSTEYCVFERELGESGIKDVTALPAHDGVATVDHEMTTSRELERDVKREERGGDGKKKERVWEPTFACVDPITGKPLETLLTCPSLLGRPQCLDFVFVGGGGNGATATKGEVRPFRVQGRNFQQVSDHCGVEATAVFGERVAGKGAVRDRRNT